MMDPISIAMGLATAVPTIIRWISGDDQSQAASVADTALNVAKAITGKGDPKDAVSTVLADPALTLQFQQSWMAHELSLYQEETKRLQSVNETMRAEYASGDSYTRRMRPTFGYVLAASWGTLMFAITYKMLFSPREAIDLIKAVADLEAMWAVALGVLGIHVWKRSTEKINALGTGGGGGVADTILQRIRGK